MFAGFDYGSSNCAMGIISNSPLHTYSNQVELLPLNTHTPFVPSCLYALERELICEYVAKNISHSTQQNQYMQQRDGQLRLAAHARRELDLRPGETSLFIGEEALQNYIELPDEGYFVKSPKSFLGASGLQPQHLAFFEDIVSAMMQQLKSSADRLTGQPITQTVIGRPVNFQGGQGEKANIQACNILHTSAKRAGFIDIELLYEPIAAAIDYESGLETDQIVLVVDVGGGTTDCSIVQMGPNHRDKQDREDDFLAHSGTRVGGNDLDIHLAYRTLMPLFGLGDYLKTDRPLPNQPYWNAVSINDIAAQSEFNSRENIQLLKQLHLDARSPSAIQRLLKLQQDKQNYQIVRSSELCKIALSSQDTYQVNLDYIEHALHQTVSKELYAQAIEKPVSTVISLMKEALEQAQCMPDLIYITGGTAKSPVVQQAIKTCIGNIPVVDGDHFGSVTAGLTKWAAKLYR